MSTNLHLTAAEYDQMVASGGFDHLQRNIELFRGELREMSPAGPVHDDLIRYLTAWSVRSTASEATSVSVQSGLDLSDLSSRPEPDLLWIRPGRYRMRHPGAADVQLAIEVSESSLKADLIDKAQLYAEAAIVEYWVVDAQAECIHVFREARDGVYSLRRVARKGEQLQPLAVCSSPLDLNDLFE